MKFIKFLLLTSFTFSVPNILQAAESLENLTKDQATESSENLTKDQIDQALYFLVRTRNPKEFNFRTIRVPAREYKTLGDLKTDLHNRFGFENVIIFDPAEPIDDNDFMPARDFYEKYRDSNLIALLVPLRQPETKVDQETKQKLKEVKKSETIIKVYAPDLKRFKNIRIKKKGRTALTLRLFLAKELGINKNDFEIIFTSRTTSENIKDDLSIEELYKKNSKGRTYIRFKTGINVNPEIIAKVFRNLA